MLITATTLAGSLHDETVVVFDCRHDLSDPSKGAALYAGGHLPGAFFAPVESALSGHKSGLNGRHPLPDPAAFSAFLTAHGVTPATTVVAYDDVGGLFAARLWWLCRWIGHPHAALLDGGWQAWCAGAHPVETETPLPRPAPHPLPVRVAGDAVWSAADVQKRLHRAESLLIDARAPERYRGEVEPLDPVAGHIPGAINHFYKNNLCADLTFRPAQELRADFERLLGSRPPNEVGHSCGSGITACANIFAMELAGLGGTKLYAGSWSEWVSEPARPVTRGPA